MVNHTQLQLSNEIRDPVLIAVMGVTGVGKSYFIEKATGLPVVVGHGQESCTVDPMQFNIPGTNIFLIDTPGFDDTHSNDATILDKINEYLADLYHDKRQISGILYIHAITETRMKGSALKNLAMFYEVIGKANMRSCCLVTTKWSQQDQTLSVQREEELCSNKKFWQPMIAKGAHVARFDDTMESAAEIIKPLLRGHPFTPQITIETQVECKKLGNTVAGRIVNTNLEEAEKAHRLDIAKLEKQYKKAADEKDEEMKELIAEQRRELEDELSTLKSERELLHASIRERHTNRKMVRWVARGVAAGASVMLAAGTAGAAAVPAAALYAGMEALTQIDRVVEG